MTVDLFSVGLAVTACCLAYLLYRLITCTDSLEWADLVATNGKFNAYKLGYWIGSIIGGWVVVKASIIGNLSGEIFAGYLAFLGGVNVLNSFGRSLASNPGGRGYRYSPDLDRSGDDCEEPLQSGPGRDRGAVRGVQRSSFSTREGSRGEGKAKGGR